MKSVQIKNTRWEFYTDKGGEYRWRTFALNNEQIGSSHTGFKSNQACKNNARLQSEYTL